MIRVGGYSISLHDYEKLLKLALQYETGRIKQSKFVKEFYKILKKYNVPKSAIWRIQYELVRHISEYHLVKAVLRFTRPVREPYSWRHYNRHPIQVTVFKITPGKELLKTIGCIEELSDQIIKDLLANWNKGLSAPVVHFDEEHSVYPIIDRLTEERRKNWWGI